MTDQTPILPIVRHDGWTPERRTQFLDHLAIDGSVRAACGRVGMSREAAYRLRRRDGLFARGWNAALLLAREAAAEVLECRAIHGVEEEIWFRGELVGTRRKYDSRLLLAHMARLDRIAEDERAGDDAARFDELLALVGGERVQSQLAVPDDVLPLPREDAIGAARTAAVEAWENTPKRARAGGCYDAADRAAVETAAQCDEWLSRAHRSVDCLLETPCVEGARTLSGLSTSPAGEADQERTRGGVTLVPSRPPSADAPAEASADLDTGKPVREPRYEDFEPSPTSWRDYCEARKNYHQKRLAQRGPLR